MGDVSVVLSEENVDILDVNLKVSHHLAFLNLTPWRSEISPN